MGMQRITTLFPKVYLKRTALTHPGFEYVDIHSPKKHLCIRTMWGPQTLCLLVYNPISNYGYKYHINPNETKL